MSDPQKVVFMSPADVRRQANAVVGFHQLMSTVMDTATATRLTRAWTMSGALRPDQAPFTPDPSPFTTEQVERMWETGEAPDGLTP